MRKYILFSSLVIVLTVFAAACSSSEDPTPTATQEPSPTPSPTATSTPEPTPTSTPTQVPSPTPTVIPSPTPTPGPPTAAEIFESVSGSIAFIETEIATGSGILIEDGYVLTNTHVVWPYSSVARVVFPDGTELLDVPVHAQDHMADLALLGPVDIDIEPLAMGDGESAPVGSDTYLIGYPGEFEEFPQPTFARGLISRTRQWESPNLTYLQTDHVVAGGQSGGALVSDVGELIGVSGLGITDASYALSLSTADIVNRVGQMKSGQEPNGLGDRSVSLTGGAVSQVFTLTDEWHMANFMAIGETGTAATMTVSGQNDAWLYVTDAYGDFVASEDVTVTGEETATFTFDVPGPFIASVLQLTPFSGEFTLECDCELIPVPDVDDRRRVFPGSTVTASMDVRGDSDHFEISLDEGDVIEVTVDTANFDGYLGVGWIGSAEEETLYDDDTGLGVIGLNPQGVFRAPYTGDFTIYVRDVNDTYEGGYYLGIELVSEDDPRAFPPAPETVETEFGPMIVFKLPNVPYTVLAPAGWERTGPVPEQGIVAQFNDGNAQTLVLTVEDITGITAGQDPLNEYTELVKQVIAPTGVTVLSDSTITTTDGLEARVLELSVFGGQFRGYRQITIHDAIFGISITTLGDASLFGTSASLYEFINDSLTEVQ